MALPLVWGATDAEAAPHQWTAVTDRRGERLFGPVAITYAAQPDRSGSRIVCRLVVPRTGVVNRIRGRLLAWGDLVMRRQLLNLKALAEHDAAA